MNIFQWLVDTTQRRPIWWCRQCVVATFVGALLAAVVKYPPTGFLNILVVAVWLGTAYLLKGMCRNETALAFAAGPAWLDKILWASSLFFGIPMLLTGNPLALCATAQAAFYSFAACRPPAPPKTRRAGRLAFRP